MQLGVSFFDEKARSTATIGALARYCGACFLPYMEKSVKCLLSLTRSFNVNVRAAAMGSLHEMALCLKESLPRTSVWLSVFTT